MKKHSYLKVVLLALLAQGCGAKAFTHLERPLGAGVLQRTPVALSVLSTNLKYKDLAFDLHEGLARRLQEEGTLTSLAPTPESVGLKVDVQLEILQYVGGVARFFLGALAGSAHSQAIVTVADRNGQVLAKARFVGMSTDYPMYGSTTSTTLKVMTDEIVVFLRGVPDVGGPPGPGPQARQQGT